MARRSNIRREKDMLVIEKRYMRGESQTQIAHSLGVTQQTVSNDLKEIIRRWREETTFDITEMKSRELSKINNLEITYWEGWERSLEDAETKTTRAKASRNVENGETSNVEPVERTMQARGQAGNPAFLTGVQWCIAKRCELLGLDAPTKLDVNMCHVVGLDTDKI